MTLQWKTVAEPSGRTLVISGTIDEKCTFTSLASEIQDGDVLDMSGIDRVNSAGVREWMTFARGLTASGKGVRLSRCAVPVVYQLNMVRGFSGGGGVVSVMAPFLCSSCDEVHLREIKTDSDVRAAANEQPQCPTCNEPMEFDELPDQFFSFARR